MAKKEAGSLAELIEAEADQVKLKKAVDFLKWLETWLRSRDFEIRKKVVACLKDIGEWPTE